MFSTAPMDRLSYLGYPNDAEVDALLSQLGDESLLKLKVNTHTTSSRGFEYPTFKDGWTGDDATEALDTQLTSRFSSLKRPIAPPKKKGWDSGKGGKKVFDSDGGLGGKNGSSRDVPTAGAGKKTRDSRSQDRRAGDSDSMAAGSWKGDGEESGSLSSSRGSSRRREDGGSSRRHPINREGSRGLSQRAEFLSFRSSDDPAATDEDPDSLDAVLNERFRALKAPSPPALPHSPSSTPPSTRNLGLDKIIQISGQLSTSDYDAWSSFSTASSPSANLLGRTKSRSSPRVMTTSVATSCHCTTPSPLKLLKQVGSKSFPSRQQPAPGSLPPLSPAPRSSKAAAAKKAARDYKVEGFGNSRPVGKESDEKKSPQEKKKKLEKKKSSKGESNQNTNNSPSTVKDMRRLLSSVADRVGLERSRVSSAVDDEFLGEDLNVWSVMDDGEKEFATASSEEQRLNREAERVVEWAKDAARLGTGESDMDSEADVDDLRLEQEDGTQDSDEGTPKKKGNPKKKIFKVAPKKKTWGFF